MVKNNFFNIFGGMTQWLYQRFTAVYMLLYLFFMVITILNKSPINFHMWTNIFDSTYIQLATILFFLLMFFHSWIGMLHITSDYIKNKIIRIFLNQIFALMSIIQVIIICMLFMGNFR
ncbi:MAG: succinate dehydrogenase, hydrophobic membrane anchor protein [Nitrosomonadales bacterium]|nr:succinate dehydrogenase, hydrophobic membrane anchor protein [Nitrosomonadales bacterium]|tara:strand:- start:684 stop:1037 length:354 start_codon:yes stop_codon:yes gene_type:complete